MALSEDLLITPTLLKRWIEEGEMDGGDGRHYGIVRRDNGDIQVHHPGSPHVLPHQVLWASRVLGMLNRELHHDGAWVIVFTHPKPRDAGSPNPAHVEYARYALIWLDADGDPQFTQEWKENEADELLDFTEVVLAGIVSTVSKAEGSWQTWHLMMRQVIEPREGQTFKRARGERPASTRH